MGRKILAVIAGYLVMFACVFLSLTAAYFAMGADRAFRPGTYDISALWAATMIILGLLAAIAGGMTCRAIAGSGAGKALAIIVFVLGILFAVPALTATEASKPGPRASGVSNLEAMTKAQTPAWAALLNAVIGGVGVLVGSRRKA